MKKSNLAFMLLLTVAFVLGCGAKASAQESLFGRENNGPRGGNHEESLLRGAVNGSGFELGGVTNNENPETAPLGSGIAMLVAAGAGYALLKRKEEQQ